MQTKEENKGINADGVDLGEMSGGGWAVASISSSNSNLDCPASNLASREKPQKSNEIFNNW